MGQSLKSRYKEHISIKFNKEDSGYATHILRKLHCYGKMEEIMDKIDHAIRGCIMNIKKKVSYI
jgi:hypothetical protein